jgi:hypothetical protein
MPSYGLPRALRMRDKVGEGQKITAQGPVQTQKYGTKRADIQSIVFAGLSQRQDDLYLGLIRRRGFCDDKHSQAIRAKAKTHSTRSSTAWRQL